jgi:restriction endonuclease S subunit
MTALIQEQQTPTDSKPNQRDWPIVKLKHVCEINPRRPALHRADNALTTFIPMPSVAEAGAGIVKPELKQFRDVRKGYTYFVEGDVLFAKITPCMQNGKHAIATDLADGIGFGSTEFHVLSPGPQVTPEWIHFFLLQPQVLQNATAHFAGAVGQQRVPANFLSELSLPLPGISEQRRIAGTLREQLTEVAKARAATEMQLVAAQTLPSCYLRGLFRGTRANTWPKRKLGEVIRLRKEVIHPRNSPQGPAVFVGLEHIESLTGNRTGSRPVELSQLTGRKPRFYSGDIVYGYLRPYLNKVWIAEFDGLCSVDQYVYHANQELAETEFVAWFMRSPVYLERAPVDATPGWLPRIRTDEVASVQINLPSLEEQRAVIKEIQIQLNSATSLTNALSTRLEALDRTPAALLRDAFSETLSRPL